MLASQAANVIGRHHRGISERFFERVRQELYGFLDLRFDEQFVMLSSKMLCNDPRMLRFVEVRFGKSNRKGFDLARTCTGHQRHDRRRINSPTEQCADGDITDQPDAHGLGESLFHFFQALFFAGRLVASVAR